MASRAKHAQRAHYSYHSVAPFYQFHRNAYTKEQGKEQRSRLMSAISAFKSILKKRKEGE